MLDEEGKKVKALRDGKAEVTDQAVTVSTTVEKEQEYLIPAGTSVWVKDGDLIEPGTQLTDGSLDLSKLHKVRGREAVQNYILKEIQYIYKSQGQPLNDKHIEVIIKQMFSRVYITDSADTNLLEGEVVEKSELLEENERVAEEGGKPAEFQEVFLGISKVSLSTKSFLSAASFQETAKVLINAAVTGKLDKLEGLKENVIIGRLIPAGTGFDTRSAELEEEIKQTLAERTAADTTTSDEAAESDESAEADAEEEVEAKTDAAEEAESKDKADAKE